MATSQGPNSGTRLTEAEKVEGELALPRPRVLIFAGNHRQGDWARGILWAKFAMFMCCRRDDFIVVTDYVQLQGVNPRHCFVVKVGTWAQVEQVVHAWDMFMVRAGAFAAHVIELGIWETGNVRTY